MVRPPQAEGDSENRVEVDLRLRGGHRFALQLVHGSLALTQLRRWKSSAGLGIAELIQLPLLEGNRALSVYSADIRTVHFPREGEHPTMNVSEGHLGGYISACHPLSEKLGTQRGDPATYTPALWEWMYRELGIDSMLDVGCGEGHTAAFFRSLGCFVRGVDGSQLAQRDSVIGEDHVLHDFNQGPYRPDSSFDLVWSCEFVEHVHERYVDNFLASFGAARRYLFITAAPPGQPGWHHVNCQLPAYWIKHIEPLGLRFDQRLTDATRALAGKAHFARQGLVFTRSS